MGLDAGLPFDARRQFLGIGRGEGVAHKILFIPCPQAIARSSQHRAVMSSLWSLLLAF